VKRLLALAAVVAAWGAAAPGTAMATNECNGLQQCVPVHGPWVVVPTGTTVPRPRVEYRIRCPRGYVAGGLDAQLSDRAIDLGFLGRIGAPINPGISTSRAVVFYGTYVGATARAPSFRPHVGCMPAGGGGRLPTARIVFPPGQPTIRRVREVRVRPGRRTAALACTGRERLVAASHAFGFFTRTPPSASLVASVSGRQSITGNRVAVLVGADAEVAAVRAVVQVHAVCARAR
jgi:hypothetical protein